MNRPSLAVLPLACALPALALRAMLQGLAPRDVPVSAAG
jgi:hypothetical protein